MLIITILINSKPVRGAIVESLWRNRIVMMPIKPIAKPWGLVDPASNTNIRALSTISRLVGLKHAKLIPTNANVAMRKKKESAIGQCTRINMSTENISNAATNTDSKGILKRICINAVKDVIASAWNATLRPASIWGQTESK